MHIAWSTNSQDPEPGRSPWFVESATELRHQLARCIDDELFIFPTDMALGALVATQYHGRDKNVVEGRLQPIFVAITNSPCASTGLIHLEKSAIVVVIVLKLSVGAKQN